MEFILKVQRDLHIRNRPTRINRANSNLSMRKVLLVGVKKTTNIVFIGHDVTSAGYNETEAGFQITAEIPPLISFTFKVSGKPALSTKFVYLFLD